MRDHRDALSSLASGIGSLLLLGGLPAALWRWVGNPLPASLPAVDTLSWHLTNGQIPDRFWIGTFALVLWFVWAQLAIAFVHEAIAAVRGVQAERLPGLGAAQRLVGPIVARLAVALSLIGTTPTPSLASPLIAPPAASMPIGNARPLADPRVHTAEVAAPVSDVLVRTPSTQVQRIVTQRRDTLRSLAAEHLGSADSWRVLRDANVGRTMTDGTVFSQQTVTLAPGWELLVPGSDTDSTEEAVGTVEVVPGDHFWKLAERAMTDAWGRAPTDEELTPYWWSMVEANDGRLLPPEDPNLIYPGQNFVVPTPPPNPDRPPSARGSAAEPLADCVAVDDAVETAPPVDPPPATPPAPPTTQAPAAVTPQPTTPVDVDAERDAPADIDPARVGLFVGVGAITLGLVGITLRRLHRRRAARRPSGVVIDASPDVLLVEDQIRALSTDGEDARYLAALNPWMSHSLSRSDRLPAVVAVRAGANGLELLLDEPCAMPMQFVSTGDSAKSWRLHSDVTERQMEKEGSASHPYMPALLSVGDTEVGELFFDFEQLGAISLQGPAETCSRFLQTLALGALGLPWSDLCDIVAIGVPGIDPTVHDRIDVPADPFQWAERTVERVTRDAKDTSVGPYEKRVRGGVDEHPIIVLIGADHAGVAQHLAPAAELAYSSLVVIAATELRSEHRIVLTETVGKLEPLDLGWDLQLAELPDVVAIGAALADADAPVPGPLEIDPAELAWAQSPAQTSPSMETLEAIERILTPTTVELSLLTENPRLLGVDLQPKAESVTAYIAMHPGCATSRVRELFWDEDSSRSADNTITKIRKQLADAGGEAALPRSTDTYTLLGVGCDWHRFTQLAEAAAKATSTIDAAAYLDAALELVEGVPGMNANTALWGWFFEDSRWYLEIDRVVIDAAVRRAEIALAGEDPIGARHAIHQGNLVSPRSESLTRLSMLTSAMLHDLRAVDDQFKAALSEAEADGIDLTPETYRLYELLRSGQSVGSNGAVTRP